MVIFPTSVPTHAECSQTHKTETHPSSDCKDGKPLFGVNGRSSPWFTGTPIGPTKPYFPLPRAHIPETKLSWPTLLFDMPHSPCCTARRMQAGRWGIPRSSHQPNQLPHHTQSMGSRSRLPSLKSASLHAEFTQGCKILGSHWNIQGICFPRRFQLCSKDSPHWERTQQLHQQKVPLLRALLRPGRGCHLCPCSLHLFPKPFD